MGRIEFGAGECRLTAAEGLLTLSLAAADLSELGRLQDVVARHLVRFAFREDLRIEWRSAEE